MEMMLDKWPGTLYTEPVSRGRELNVDSQHKGKPLETK